MANSTKTIMKLLPLLLPLLLVAPANMTAQEVPISFDKYHGYSGTVEYLQKVNSAYPEITELITIGKSNMGREIQVLVVSNMKNGTTLDRHVKLYNERKEGVKNVTPMKSHQGKPDHFISGATHGNEYTGTEVCLYIIDKLVTGYNNDEEIRNLIDRNAFYICPAINPDGLFNSVEKDMDMAWLPTGFINSMGYIQLPLNYGTLWLIYQD